MTDTSLTDLLPRGQLIVLCGRQDDAIAWQELIGPDRCLAVPLDSTPIRPARTPRGATDHLAWQHQIIAGLDQPTWLTAQADAFDPRREARLLLSDPLDPILAGTRRTFGRRDPMYRLLENKTVVDSIWDAIGLPRARSIVADRPVDLTRLGRLVGEGNGVVCAARPADGPPSAGGDDIYWWRDQPPSHLSHLRPGGRVRLMPLLAGLPTRVHGLVTADNVIAFPPLEVIALPRPDRGTFLCAGTAPTLGEHSQLRAVTERAGDALRNMLGYRGAFSIDGILTTHGFRPTDLNARLTSAMEAAPPALRVRLHLANMLAREGAPLDPNALRTLAQDTFAVPERYTLYGAASSANGTPRTVLIRWHGQRLLVAYDDHVHGQLAITRSLRGWLLTATLHSRHLPTAGPLNAIAPQIFELSDTAFGTDFGTLTPQAT